MANDTSAADRVQALVRTQLVSGVIVPGAHVDVVRLASVHRTSATPVREALARLQGEGFLEITPRRGYSAPALSRVGLQELYDWSEVLMEAVVRRAGPLAALLPSAPSATPEDYVARVDAVTRAGVNAAGNTHAAMALARVHARLQLARWSEAVVIEGALGEIARLDERLRSGRGAVAALRRFHARRRDRASDIIGHVLARLANGGQHAG